jgi:uncharacterized protein (TIGR03000 family)
MSKVVVTVPEDAQLYIDGQKSSMTSTERTFVTPKLQVGERYFYDLRAEVVRDGQVKSLNRRVILSAGDIARVDFTELSAPTVVDTTGSAQVTVRVPKEARLFVDGKQVPQTSTVRKFSTPRLTPGEMYYYTVRVELDRDGKTLSDSKRVIVEAGKKVDLTFTDSLDPTHTASR